MSSVTQERLRIVVVENRAGAAARLTSQLESLGHHVVGLAADGREAIDRASRLKPDLIIIALRLPGMDGSEAAHTIVAHEPLPVVLLVGHDAAEFVRRAREVGIMAYLVTPADTQRLGSVINAALARFREFQAIRRETADLEEALAIRNAVEQAKSVLMRRLKISEAEAFQRLRRTQTTGPGLGERAVVILQSERLLLKEDTLVRNLRSVLPAIRRGLRPSALRWRHDVSAPAASRPGAAGGSLSPPGARSGELVRRR